MSFKFVNWLFGQKNKGDELATIAQKYIADHEFPTGAKQFHEIIEYLHSTNASKNEIDKVYEAWNEYRTLSKVRVFPINQLRSKYFEV